MKNLGTKKNILRILLSYLLLVGIFVSYALISSCPTGQYCNKTIGGFLGLVIVILAPLLIVLPFSLVTYKMRDEVFEHWRNFSLWYIPTLIVLTQIVVNGESAGGGFGGVVSSWFMGILILFLVIIYILTSITLIVKKRAEFKK